MTTFTASEVRDAAIAVVARDMEYEAEMLRAYADRLEAEEKAVPMAIVCDGYDGDRTGCIKSDKPLPMGTNLYTRPAPADTERLAEALRKIAREPVKPWPDPFAHSHEAFARAVHATWCDTNRTARDALAAHSAQAQPPAANVTDEMVERARSAFVQADDGSTGITDAIRAALLAALENPNG